MKAAAEADDESGSFGGDCFGEAPEAKTKAAAKAERKAAEKASKLGAKAGKAADLAKKVRRASSLEGGGTFGPDDEGATQAEVDELVSMLFGDDI